MDGTATGEVIAVTGASRGIGAAIARELGGRGFQVACLTRRGVGLEDAEPNPAIAARLAAYRCDVTDEASVTAALAAVVRDHGRLAGLVNNAGVLVSGPSKAFSTRDFEFVLATNAVSAFVASREAYPHLVANGGGLIVNIGSFYAKLGIRRTAAYCASKAAVEAITRSLAVEWARDGIRVLAVAPGFVATDLNRDFQETDGFDAYMKKRVPMGRAGDPGEVARLVAALYQENIAYLTGETIYIDGGHSIAQ